MDKTVEQLKREGFAQDQIAEIEEGRKAGLDVSVYSQKEFLAIQMHQIRLGMEEGLAVEKYASPEYDWFQMEEIRMGLLEGVGIEAYASPAISYDRMHQIRKGLSEGIDLSPYKSLNAGILKELRLAVQNKISIVPYITGGYDAEQLEAIRMAMEKGLRIQPYLKKDYRGISIREICEGLEHGVDVSVYASLEYCWQQMREIRLGMEHMVDVEQYKNAYYSWRQMREIRLGLEDGLDVSYYRSFKYTADEMRKRRIALQENQTVAFVKEELSPVEPDTTEHCLVTVSPDEMEAYLEVFGNIKEVRRIDVLKELRNKGVFFGIQYEDIDNVINGNSFRKKVLIAKGSPTTEGKDGWYEFFFRTEVARTPKELEQGNVDYRTVEWFETVAEGQKLAYYHSATPGLDGTSVTGRTIPARNGREQGILTGTGFRRLSDGKTYISTMTGIVSIQELQLNISSLLIVPEVNLTTGNVDFNGNVLVQGNVSSGAKVHATGDIVVQGYVEAAELTCGGNAVLKQGMNASGCGLLRAGRDIVGCFFEATELCAGGNIQGNYFLNCKIHAEGNVRVTGKKGVLAGGSVFAERGLRTHNLGNQAGLATYVKLGVLERLLREGEMLESEIKTVRRELAALGNAHRDFQRRYTAEVRNTMELYLKIESTIYAKEKELESLLQEKGKLEAKKQKTDVVCAIIENQLNDGVTIEIDGIRWNAKSVRKAVVRKKGNRLAVLTK